MSFTAVVGGVVLVAIVSKVYNAYLYSFGGYMEEDKSFTFKMPASVFMDLQEIADALGVTDLRELADPVAADPDADRVSLDALKAEKAQLKKRLDQIANEIASANK